MESTPIPESFDLTKLFRNINDYINGEVEYLQDPTTGKIDPNFLGQIERARAYANEQVFSGCATREAVMARVAELILKKGGEEAENDDVLGLKFIREALERGN